MLKSLFYIFVPSCILLFIWGCSGEEISEVDFAYALFENFELLDMNRDNFLTLQEAQSLVSGLSLETFLSFDKDGDQKLTDEEIKEAVNKMTTCGVRFQRGISCVGDTVSKWFNDFMTILFTMSILLYMGNTKK